ncbi:MAG: tRNA 2-selenouridine synthase [Arcticibacterium sp.]|jgi:tRNA 2-selenouridine synthase
MAVNKLDIEDFLDLAKNLPILDVRSPSEFAHTHISGALSFPLFTDEQRKVVGTSYKQESRETAIKIGLDYFGPRMREVVETAEIICIGKAKEVLIHCWRGGMRSGAVAWLLDLYGFKVHSLIGGYKAYRNWVISQYSIQREFKILGGYTGSAKTEVLAALSKSGLAVIDLEGIANHRGSALGGIGQPPQPSQEMFENLLGMALHKNHDAPFILLEDESQRIGNMQIPNVFYAMMKSSTVYFLEIPFESRLDFICQTYGKLPREQVIEAIYRIQKRLGGLETKSAVTLIESGDIKGCFEILLHYYDKCYLKASQKKSAIIHVPLSSVDIKANQKVLEKSFNEQT